MSVMHYKGYSAKVDYSDEDHEFVGRVLGIRDIIGFHGTSVGELEKDFHEALDFYLDSCEKRGKTPDRPYSGRLNLRLPPDLHRVVAMAAESTDTSINDAIVSVLADVYSKKKAAKTKRSVDKKIRRAGRSASKK